MLPATAEVDRYRRGGRDPCTAFGLNSALETRESKHALRVSPNTLCRRTSALRHRLPQHGDDVPQRGKYVSATWRDWFTHHVLIGKDANGQVVIAQNAYGCNCKCLLSEGWIDAFAWLISQNAAETKVMVCEFSSKPNIGHSGNTIEVMAVHCTYDTREEQRQLHLLCKERKHTSMWTLQVCGGTESSASSRHARFVS